VYGYHSIFEDPGIAVAKIDMGYYNNNSAEEPDIWTGGPGWYALEPRFIPRSSSSSSSSSSSLSTANECQEDEDDGWLICQLFDAANVKSHLALFDAKKVSAGPVAIIDLPAPLPHNLHSYWDNE
jgi:carotenoid cleavage dioxygenase-like enzyme